MKMKVVVLSGRGADAHVVHSNGRIIAPVFCDTSYLPTIGMKISRLLLHLSQRKA